MISSPLVKRSSDNYKPGQQAEDRKKVFASLNSYITVRGGFVTSVPGAAVVEFECLPGSPIPEMLGELGYRVGPADPPETQRLLAHAITQRLTLSSCGVFEEMTEGSTKAVVETRRHAGIVKVARWQFPVSF